jgi:Zn finger protein HypA/HybF involved in hydrogenase expression
MMLLQKSNLDDRMTDDCHIYCDGSTTATATATTTTTTTTTTDTAYQHQQQQHTNTNKLSNEKKRTITKQRHFLLCESCFWCASSIYLVSMDWICPVCGSNNNNDNNNKVESIPIQNNEIYKFDYNQRHGVILEFLESVV